MPQSQDNALAKPPYIGALLRAPAEAIRRKLIDDLKAAGFEYLSVPHMAVLQYPGPDGVRPSMLAERAGMSKQAMNQLLKTLEGLGYVTRSAVPDESGARVVRLTKQGHAVYKKMGEILQEIEHEFSVELGPKRFAQLKELLGVLWDSRLVR
ncbi:MarR family winged helix-turn-helix transcriptional regulator [Bradyrhizobium sp. CCGUVB1N3]|uniref:MarR family winged helix-turn-helix transcriptional regulator n=1 Tax=Bradyrhizobium sp. CCGUVB1N3 TaxID=2949629 RepID=UPI0020B2A046|nr:MarR family winged helix-turn-helix transcriptional regulator [Bradyrhizobium sp. CCGUVB1N3]MCP3470146.1 MarR family winged helix-turn-helix transcriptional regulator [Bradyrhizobium sp. CCGUVB1N3]